MPRPSLFLLSTLLIAGLGAGGCGGGLPDPASDTYREAVSAFYTGLAAVQSGAEAAGEERLLRVTQLVPQEPAAWADLGLLAMRQNNFDLAAERLEKARTLAPDNSAIQLLSGLLESNLGRPAEAMAFFRRAAALDSTNLKAKYALLQEIERLEDPAAQDEVPRLLAEMRATQPRNLAVLTEQARVAAQRGDAETLRRAVAQLAERATAWPPEVQEQMRALQAAASASDLAPTAPRVAFLKNVLLRLPAYRRDLAALQTPTEQVADLVTRFLRLPAPRATPAPPDDSLAFAAEPQNVPGGPWTWAGVVWLKSEGGPDQLEARSRETRNVGGATLDFPGGAQAAAPPPNGIAGLDFDYDFLTDLALAGAGGLRLYRQDTTGAFTDATAAMDLPAAVTDAAYAGAWAADLDLEGDVDLVLAPPDGPPRVLRNNGDGTFAPMPLFESVATLRGFAWADLDGDGDPDAALLEASGRLRLFVNERGGRFEEPALPPAVGDALALTVADLDSDGTVDLVALQADGAVLRLSNPGGAAAWTAAEVARWDDPPATLRPGAVRLVALDFDNNGGPDLLASAPEAGRLWLSDTQHALQPLDDADLAGILAVEDLSGDGRLDLVRLSADGQPVRLVNLGARPYHWKEIRPRAATALGDQRINSFGIGGEIEVRAGLLFQKQPITGPVVHFGLGQYLVADVARIIWPNGDVQAEFDLLSDQVISAQQRLKGSCPWVFAFDGRQMRFVTDFLWRSPLGLRINAQETAGVMMTEDWVKIRGDQLAAQDGFYDVRITAELWETHFFDHVALLAVDHPADTEVFVDERFAFPPPALAVHTTAPPRPVARAWDDHGRDVTDVVRTRDQRYLDTFGRGRYQGLTRDHFVEIELGDDAPTDAPLLLLASGWIRPTDSSINVALSQGRHGPPQGLRLDVPDGQGGWITAKDGLGFPAGKEKTILIDLDGVFRPGTPRRLRLRTNMEIFWDALAWAAPRPRAEVRTHRLDPETALLRYRGFSEVTEADRSSPEVPHYDRLAGREQAWRDLVGYYTRFGDVRELLRRVDDRYVIMNAGDELAFRFAEPPPPPEGWRRDFVLVGDGWVKDGDYNTGFSKTVLPLPSHDTPAYDSPPGRLEDDPVYRRHPDDWQRFHTRYVTPQRFRDALRLE